MPYIKFGNKIFQIELGSPDPELQEVANKELRENPELQKESIARLRELLKGSILNNIKKFNKVAYKVDIKLYILYM